jgi:hypothetical protein
LRYGDVDMSEPIRMYLFRLAQLELQMSENKRPRPKDDTEGTAKRRPGDDVWTEISKPNTRRKGKVLLVLGEPKIKESGKFWRYNQEDIEEFLVVDKDNIKKQFEYLMNKMKDPFADRKWFLANTGFLLRLMAVQDRNTPCIYEYDRILPEEEITGIFYEEDENDPFEKFLKDRDAKRQNPPCTIAPVVSETKE